LEHFPVLLVLYAVRVNLERLSDVLFAHVCLTVVEEDATAPEEEVWVLNELTLHLRCVLHCLSQVSQVRTN
jgi:hypothetical protein